MNDTPLRAALRKLLAQGEQVSDSNMKRAHAAKNAPPPNPAESCPECKAPLEEGECAECGYEKPDDEAGLAEVLEQGAAEG